jgi:surface antigen
VTAVQLKAAVGNAASYAVGQCTWGVASLLAWIPAGLGNANQWIANAAKKGLTISQSPSVGDVVVYQGGVSAATPYSPSAEYSSLGHVGVVSALGPADTFTVEEMNYNADGGGLGIYDTRKSSTQNVQGFIQPPAGTSGFSSTAASAATASTAAASAAATAAQGCAWQGPFGWCILSQAGEQKLFGALLMGAGGLVLLVGAGLVIIGTLSETKLGRTAAKVASETGVGAVVGAAVAPVRAVQGGRQRRTAGRAKQAQATQRSADESQRRLTRQQIDRARVRRARAQARDSEATARLRVPPQEKTRTRTVVRTYNPSGGGSPASRATRGRRGPVQNQKKYNAVFGD